MQTSSLHIKCTTATNQNVNTGCIKDDTKPFYSCSLTDNCTAKPSYTSVNGNNGSACENHKADHGRLCVGTLTADYNAKYAQNSW